MDWWTFNNEGLYQSEEGACVKRSHTVVVAAVVRRAAYFATA